MNKNRILQEATIDQNAIRYNLLGAGIGLAATIVGIPLLLIYIPLARWYWSRYYARLRVVLTTRELKVHRGIFVREEKSIPLEKITDLAVYQGPVMRFLDLKGIRVETAGQSSGAGRALVQIVGIHETEAFRDLVLAQRDHIAEGGVDSKGPAAPAGPEARADGAMLVAIEDIRDTLRRVEARISAEEPRGAGRD